VRASTCAIEWRKSKSHDHLLAQASALAYAPLPRVQRRRAGVSGLAIRIAHGPGSESPHHGGEQLLKTRKWLAPLAAIASMLCVALLSAPAHAANDFQYVNSVTQMCLQEDGTTSAVYDGGCGWNSSDYWYQNSDGNLVNAHSQRCLAVTGQDEGVYATSSCGNNHAEEWEMEDDGFEIVNEHTGWCLFQEPGPANAVGQQNCSDPGNEFWIQTNA
jgi:hypothetical protein